MLQLIFGGISQGCIYGLIALGFVLIYKATETISFAQGELMMVGAFGALLLTKSLGFTYGFAVVTAVAALALIGLMLERMVIRPVLGQTSLAIVLITLGLGYVARGLIAMVPDIGTETHTLQVPYAGQVLVVGGAVISYDHLMVIGSTILVSLFLYVMFRFSKVGIAMRATSQNQQHHHVSRDLLKTFRQIEARKGFYQANDDASQNGTRQTGKSAHHGSGQSLEANEAHVDVNEGDGG